MYRLWIFLGAKYTSLRSFNLLMCGVLLGVSIRIFVVELRFIYKPDLNALIFETGDVGSGFELLKKILFLIPENRKNSAILIAHKNKLVNNN